MDELNCSVDWLAVHIACMLCKIKRNVSQQIEAINQLAQLNE
jgi:hypothetical protein